MSAAKQAACDWLHSGGTFYGDLLWTFYKPMRGQDRQERSRKPASASEKASRSKSIAKRQEDKRNEVAWASAAAKAKMVEMLTIFSRC